MRNAKLAGAKESLKSEGEREGLHHINAAARLLILVARKGEKRQQSATVATQFPTRTIWGSALLS